ncbi:MAG: BirA family transcriptional regulator [Solirubrobacteraceae bacterium]|nr:BirA family transcriptional regulator [Solirubrobacteraceae bacterium]
MSALGHPRVHLRRTGSTSDRARALALVGAPHGTLVTAEEQTAGRGRQGRSWSAPAGSSVLMSLLLRDPPSLLPLIAAVAVCDVAGPAALIKWPNDIVVARPARAHARTPPLAKLAGILAEGRLQEGWAIVGIGLNAAVVLDQLPPELRGDPGGDGALPAATLGRSPLELEATLEQLLEALELRLREAPEAMLDAWRARDALYDRELTWGSSGQEGSRRRGRARGIDGEGRLIVELEDGARATLSAGEVHLVGLG